MDKSLYLVFVGLQHFVGLQQSLYCGLRGPLHGGGAAAQPGQQLASWTNSMVELLSTQDSS